MTYAATGLPAGISINTARRHRGTLTFASAGVYSVVVSVRQHAERTDPFTWTVTQSRTSSEDDFSRTVVNNWGSALIGGAYTLQGTESTTTSPARWARWH